MDTELYGNLRWLIGAMARGIAARPAEGVEETLGRLAAQDLSETAFHPPVPQRKPVLRYLEHTIAEAMMVDTDVAAALAAVAENLRWIQADNYSDALLGEGFSDNYAWCELIGADGFFRGDDFNMGFLIMGPDRDYIDHYHPAPELYWPLTAPSDWRQGEGVFEAKPAGTIIWHPSMVIHATITREKPMLAAWAWTRDTATGPRLVAQDA